MLDSLRGFVLLLDKVGVWLSLSSSLPADLRRISQFKFY